MIEVDNAEFADKPQVAFDGNGNAPAAWTQPDGAVTGTWANRFK